MSPKSCWALLKTSRHYLSTIGDINSRPGTAGESYAAEDAKKIKNHDPERRRRGRRLHIVSLSGPYNTITIIPPTTTLLYGNFSVLFLLASPMHDAPNVFYASSSTTPRPMWFWKMFGKKSISKNQMFARILFFYASVIYFIAPIIHFRL